MVFPSKRFQVAVVFLNALLEKSITKKWQHSMLCYVILCYGMQLHEILRHSIVFCGLI